MNILIHVDGIQGQIPTKQIIDLFPAASDVRIEIVDTQPALPKPEVVSQPQPEVLTCDCDQRIEFCDICEDAITIPNDEPPQDRKSNVFTCDDCNEEVSDCLCDEDIDEEIEEEFDEANKSRLDVGLPPLLSEDSDCTNTNCLDFECAGSCDEDDLILCSCADGVDVCTCGATHAEPPEGFACDDEDDVDEDEITCSKPDCPDMDCDGSCDDSELPSLMETLTTIQAKVLPQTQKLVMPIMQLPERASLPHLRPKLRPESEWVGFLPKPEDIFKASNMRVNSKQRKYLYVEGVAFIPVEKSDGIYWSIDLGPTIYNYGLTWDLLLSRVIRTSQGLLLGLKRSYARTVGVPHKYDSDYIEYLPLDEYLAYFKSKYSVDLNSRYPSSNSKKEPVEVASEVLPTFESPTRRPKTLSPKQQENYQIDIPSTPASSPEPQQELLPMIRMPRKSKLPYLRTFLKPSHLRVGFFLTEAQLRDGRFVKESHRKYLSMDGVAALPLIRDGGVYWSIDIAATLHNYSVRWNALFQRQINAENRLMIAIKKIFSTAAGKNAASMFKSDRVNFVQPAIYFASTHDRLGIDLSTSKPIVATIEEQKDKFQILPSRPTDVDVPIVTSLSELPMESGVSGKVFIFTEQDDTVRIEALKPLATNIDTIAKQIAYKNNRRLMYSLLFGIWAENDYKDLTVESVRTKMRSRSSGQLRALLERKMNKLVKVNKELGKWEITIHDVVGFGLMRLASKGRIQDVKINGLRHEVRVRDCKLAIIPCPDSADAGFAKDDLVMQTTQS